MILRSLPAVVLLAACGDPDCSLPARIDEIVDGAPLRQCGDLPTMTGGQRAYNDARACVLAAAAERAPFEVRWEIGDDEQHALIGIWSGGYQLQRLDTNKATSATFQCRAIEDLGDNCGTVFADLCLACTDETSTATCAWFRGSAP